MPPPPFKGYRSVIQEDPISPTIFNASVNAIILYGLIVVETIEVGIEGLRTLVQYLPEYLYADNGIVKPTQLKRLQMSYLSVRVSIHTKILKTVIMDFCPYHTTGGMSKFVYEI